MADLYSVLGVSKTASDKEIKNAFRKLAKQYHPDHNPDNKNAQEKFAKISQAYEILNDKEKKQKYDSGQIDSEGNPVFTGFNGFGGASGMGRNARTSDFADASDVFSSLFGSAMGAGSPFGQRSAGRQSTPYNKNFTGEVWVTLEDIVKNNKIEVICNGKNLKIQLPKDVEDGQKIRLRGQGEDKYPGKAGDAIITIRIRAHPDFEVKGRDLYGDTKVSLKEAVNGGKIIVKTLDGQVSINIPAWTSSGKVFRLKDKGLPNNLGSRGALYVKVQIVLPDEYKEQLQNLLK